MQKINFHELLKKNPTEIGFIINKLGQGVIFYEHPSAGDLSPIIAAFPNYQLAYLTDFFDLDDMIADHGEYQPVVYNGKCCCYFEIDIKDQIA